MKISIGIIGSVYGILLLLFPGDLLAFNVSPLVIDIEAEARDIITKDITITNTTGMPISIYPFVNNISLSEGGTIEEFLPPSMSDRTSSLASWIEIKRTGRDLKSGETITIPLTIRIHPSPEFGVYHALVSFGTGGNSVEAEEKVQRGQAPGVIVTVTIKDTAKEQLKLGKFFVSRFVTENENEGISYVLDNPGDKPLAPSGDIILYDGKGAEVAVIPVNPEGVQIEPGTEQAFTASVPADGLFGKYKAFLSIEYGSAQLATVHDTSFFYVFPWKKVLTILGVILLVVIIVAWVAHRRYLDTGEPRDDAEVLPLKVRESQSEEQSHDINLKQ